MNNMLNKIFPKYFFNDYNNYIIEEKQTKDRVGNITNTKYCILYAKYYFGIKIMTYFRIFEDYDDYNECYDILERNTVEKLLNKYNKTINNTSSTYIHIPQQPLNIIPNVSQQPKNNKIIKFKLT